MFATVTAFDGEGAVTHSSGRDYPDLSLLWEHIGCQQNNRRTVRVQAETETGLTYEVSFSPWSLSRRYFPSPRFQALLDSWAMDASREG